MSLPALLIYLYSAGIALATVAICFRLHRRFPLRFLLDYLYYLSAFLLAGFIDRIGRYLASSLLGGRPPETILILDHLFVFLVFPFIPLAIYFFISFVMGFLDRKTPASWIRVGAAFWSLFFLALVVAAKNFFRGGDSSLSGLLFSALSRTTLVLYLVGALFLLVKSQDLIDTSRKRAARILGSLYVLGFAIILIFSENRVGISFDRRLLNLFLYFSLNLPPLLYLRSHVRKHRPLPQSATLAAAKDLEGFSADYGLSNREREIMQLILMGKSHQDITGELFISSHTVKNHTYNIYRKLNVRNRLQLSRLVQEYLRSKTG